MSTPQRSKVIEVENLEPTPSPGQRRPEGLEEYLDDLLQDSKAEGAAGDEASAGNAPLDGYPASPGSNLQESPQREDLDRSGQQEADLSAFAEVLLSVLKLFGSSTTVDLAR